MNASLVQRAGIAGLAAALCLLTGSAANAGAAAPYVWTEIVLPSSSVANAFGPNDRGQVAVTAVDGTSGIYRNGTFTQLPAPPAGYQVSATGINNAGVIVGVASTTTDTHEQGFILVSGVYTFFSRPGWGNTEPRAIGNSGLVTGYSFQDTGETAGFVYDPAPGVFTDVTPRLSTFTIAQGINKFGRISGNGREAVLGRFGFIWQQGTFTNGPRRLLPFLDRFIVDAGSTNARGINDAGIIVGYISGATSAGFIGADTRGYRLLLPPGADVSGVTVVCEGINNARQVVCLVSDTAGNSHGFIGSVRRDEHDGNEHDRDEHDRDEHE
jgi:hypothetical protein